MKKVWWKLIAWFKRLFVLRNINNINDTYQKLLENGGKVSLIDKATHKTKKEFETNKSAFLEYTSFCKEKEIALSDKDLATINAIEKTEDILDPKGALERELKKASNEYDECYALVNEAGESLLASRNTCIATIDSVETLVNSIAAHPKDFDKQIKKITVQKRKFNDTLEFGKRNYNNNQ